MVKLYRILVLVLISLFSFSAVAVDYGKGKMVPMKHERLPRPIYLKRSCQQIRIIEWRPTPGHVYSTRLTARGIKTVDNTCNLAVRNFYKFIDDKEIYDINNAIRMQLFDTSLSFIPADLTRGGTDPRNLNDIKYRFAYRSDLDPLWGFFQRRKDWAYIRNDIFNDDGQTINKGFIVVVAHELFHAMSYASGVFNQHRPVSKKDKIEEDMAQEFTEWLLGYK